jgi:Protein of unknown function (DUF3788)
MDTSIFPDKNIKPSEESLKKAIGKSFKNWQIIYKNVHSEFKDAVDEWTYSGTKFGWSFRIKDKKRVIVYLLPREKYFKAALVFGKKATDEVMESKVSKEIIDELSKAKAYAEGRGIRVDVNEKNLKDVLTLIDIKLRN